MTKLLEKIRSLSRQDEIEITTDETEPITGTVTHTEYEPPDEYGAGNICIELQLTLDSERAELEIFPTQTAEIAVYSPSGSTDFYEPILRVWNPVYDSEDKTYIVNDGFLEVGDVTDIVMIENE